MNEKWALRRYSYNASAFRASVRFVPESCKVTEMSKTWGHFSKLVDSLSGNEKRMCKLSMNAKEHVDCAN